MKRKKRQSPHSQFVLGRYFGFPQRAEAAVWVAVAFAFSLLNAFILIPNFARPIFYPHPVRQGQTALTIYYFVRDGITWSRYPTNGKLMDFTFEFPLYQAICATWINLTGWSLETCSRGLTLVSFFVSLVFLILLVRDLVGKRAAAWTALFYWVSPFSVTYARTCLIDFFTQALCLGGLWFFVRARGERGKLRNWFVIGWVALGGMGALSKVTIWFWPNLLLSGFLAIEFLRRPSQRRSNFVFLVGISLQVMPLLIWTFVISRGVGFHRDWLLGSLEMRGHWQYWHLIFRHVTRVILNDWLVVPALAGVFFAAAHRKWVWACLAIAALSPLLLFNIHIRHDYYFIISLPYVMVVAAIGAVRIFDVRDRRLALPVFALVAFLLARSFEKFEFNYLPVIDQQWEITHVEDFADLSAAGEIISAPGLNYFYTLYANRSVVYSPMPKVRNQINATTEIDDYTRGLASNAPAVWVDGGPGFFLYRWRDFGNRHFEKDHHVAVTEVPLSSPRTRLHVGESKAIDSCASLQGVELIGQGTWVSVATENKVVASLPAKRFLSLPPKSPLGCYFIVTFRR